MLHTEGSSLVFLSEPQIYQCDLPSIAQYLDHDYCYSLNSDDLYDEELPLICNRAKGGTMVLWRRYLDPHIKVIPTTSSSYLPIVLTLPGCCPSVHVAVYMPTHGQDTEFMSELASLQNCLDNLIRTYDQPCIYIRGDANVNIKNTTRVNIMESFMKHFSLTKINIEHKTYHHFVGDGQFDSNLDVILYSAGRLVQDMQPEVIRRIICKLNNTSMHSHHDAIVSYLCIPQGQVENNTDGCITAPRLEVQRRRVVWSEKGTEEYSSLVSDQLRHLRDTWLHPQSQASMSVLLQLTNSVMNCAASATNENKILATNKAIKHKKKVPVSIRTAKNKVDKAHRRLKYSKTEADREKLKLCRKNYHKAVRVQTMKEDNARDTQLFSIIGESPAKVFSHIKRLKHTKRSATKRLIVGDKTYIDQYVADGFFESMSTLKQCDIASLQNDPDISAKLLDYEIIIKLCEDDPGTIPDISLEKSNKLLHKIKKSVKDYYSITSEHYINAGKEGLQHYNLLLNAIIADLNNASLEEVNTAHGLILYKGHHKDRSSDRSYRSICTCPFLAKSVDLYLRELYIDLWQGHQADTQYQGPGSSHELASLLLTEVLQYSRHTSNHPVYVLSLDAQSAFDRCLRQVLVSELYKTKMSPAAIALIDRRLASRLTVYEWEGTTMGPVKDTTGFEQGGINSSDYYKLYNNEQLKAAQGSRLGVDIGSCVISAIGQADDVLLVSHSLYSLQLLVTLTEQYCAKFRVLLEPTKTKLLCYSSPKQTFIVDHALNSQVITINSKPVSTVTEAEHVGVLRSTTGNMPHLLSRIAMHKKAMFCLLPAGLARRHRGNPAASLKLSQIYCMPVLLSGMASLVLSQAELKILDGHHLASLRNLLKLYDKTPRSFIYLLAGSLPASAILHQRQMSLFMMICHLVDDPLHCHAEYVLLQSERCAKSWFLQIRDICLQYKLPHPLSLLHNPPTMKQAKQLIKLRIIEYWQGLLTAEASSLSSLQHLCPTKHSIARMHPLWVSTGSNPHEINKALILVKMMSGRYRTERLCRFWSSNRHGYCLAPTCHQVVGDLEHLLLHCPALYLARSNLVKMWLMISLGLPPLHELVKEVLASPDQVKMSFILDCTTFPEIIRLHQTYGKVVQDMVLYMTRTFTYGLHRKKQILLGKWPYSTNNPDCLNIFHSNILAGISTTETEAVDSGPEVCDLSASDVPCQGVAKLTMEQPKYGVCEAVPCGGDQCHHQSCSLYCPSNTYPYSSNDPALPSYLGHYSAWPHSAGAEGEDGECTGGACVCTVIGDQGEEQFAILPPQCDLPRRCRYLQLTAVSTNPSNGMPMTSGVRAGGGCGGTGGGEACVAVGSQGYYTV